MESPMDWALKSPGCYERPFDANERPMSAFCQSTIPAYKREHWVVNAAATISLIDDQGLPVAADLAVKLKQAWVRSRWQAPYIAVVNTGSSLAYEVADKPATLAGWLSESFHIESGTLDELLLNARPNRFCTLHYFPAASQVVLRMHHWLTDGPGILKVLQNLLQFVVEDEPEPAFGDEWQRLTPPLQKMLGIPSQATAEAKQFAKDRLNDFLACQPGIGLPFKTPPAGPKGTRYIRLQHSEQASAEVPIACKRLGVGVAAAVDAAIVVATQEHATSDGLGKDYITIASFNARQHLLPPWNDLEAWPASQVLITAPYSLPSGDFLTQAQKIHDFYRQPIHRRDSLLMDAYPDYTQLLTEAAFSGPPPPGMPLPSAPQPSNMGVLEKMIKAEYVAKYKLSLTDVAIIPDVMLPPIIFEQWSWAGKMSIGASYNEAYYDEAWATAFVERVRNILFENLGIKCH